MSRENLELSVVLPAYNEAARLPSYLAAVRQHLDDRYPGRYEVLVVDGGSRDDLPGFLQRAAANWPQLRGLTHPHNRGKGAAVRTGVLAAQGQRILFADADGATPIDQEVRLTQALEAGADLAVGSRLLADPNAQRSRNWLRGLSGRMFAALARRLLPLSVRDPQCGFKMFRREVGQRLFSLARESGYLFDLEILVLAERFGYRIVELPIPWTEVPGGHMSLVRELPRIMTGLWRLRRRLSRIG